MAQLLTRGRFFAGFARGIPDGSAIDCEGHLWNCRVGRGCIVRVRPDGVTGGVIAFPCVKPTICTFGGNDLRTLYVTSAALGPAGEPNDGGLFAMDAGVCGLPENCFDV
jgi:sugar lactone lactonase YvrE